MCTAQTARGFGLQATISFFPYYFKTGENLDYLCPMPYIWYYGVDEMSGGDRKEFLAWYETGKSQLFHNKHVFEAYSQDDVTVYDNPFVVFHREFILIGNI